MHTSPTENRPARPTRPVHPARPTQHVRPTPIHPDVHNQNTIDDRDNCFIATPQPINILHIQQQKIYCYS